MSDPELERRLERALAGLPDGPPGARERAAAAAIAALPEPARSRAGRRRLTALIAAALLAVAAGGGALAAIGKLDVRIGSAPEPPAAVSAAGAGRPLLPHGADGFATLAGGRLWLATRTGLGIEALPASAAALSPRALYVAVGMGSSLVAMSPGGRRAWSHRTPGPVVAAAWAPDPILIAYVTRAGERFQLRLIEGNGRNDALLDPDVAPVAPSWRSDTKAIAYVGHGGRPLVYDRFLERRTRVAACPAAGRVGALAFAPAAGVPGEGMLALATRRGAFVAGTTAGSGGCRRLAGAAASGAVAWLSSSDVVVGTAGGVNRYRLGASVARPLGVASLAGPPLALAAAPDGTGLAVMTQRAGRVEVRLADPPAAAAATAPLRTRAVLLGVAAGRAEAQDDASVPSLGWR